MAKNLPKLKSLESQFSDNEISSTINSQRSNQSTRTLKNFKFKSKSNHGYSNLLRTFSSSTDELLEISPKSTKQINEQYNLIYAINSNINQEDKVITFRHAENKQLDSIKFTSISKVIPIHHSLCFGKRFCYRIVTNGTPNEAKSIVFSCKNPTERDHSIKQILCNISESLSTIVFEENNLKIWIQEAKNLTSKNKYYCEIQLDSLIYARTSVKEMREILIWGEEFDLTSLPSIEMVSITLWRLPRPKEKHKEPQIVSHVNIPIESIDQHCITEKWYSPSPVCMPHSVSKLAHNLTFSAACDIDDLPSSHSRIQNQITDSAPLLRAKSKYFPLKVLDSRYYLEFVDFIRENGVNMLRELEGEIKAKYREVLVWSMIQLSISENWVEEFLSDLILKEAQSCDIKIILRGNSMASKSIEFFLKLECQEYLQKILNSTIKDIIHKMNDLEIDQSQLMKKNESISVSAMKKRNQRLEMVVDKVLNKIFSSLDIIPKRVRAIFSRIRCSLKNIGTVDLEFIQRVVSACFFLRLVCPAIMTPHLFDLLPEYSDNANINRSFTLVAKCVQNIANFAGIDDTKESYMQSIALHCREYYTQMSEFINSISTVNESISCNNMINKTHGSKFAIDSARLCYNIEYHLSILPKKNYTSLQEEVKRKIAKIKEIEVNISEENDTIEKMRQNYECNDLGKTVVSTIESSGYFSTNGPYLGSVNSNLNHSPSSSLSAVNNLKFASQQYFNKHNNMMPISCPSVSEPKCHFSLNIDDDPISLRKIIVHEKKRIQLLKELVENLPFEETADFELIDLNPMNLNVNIEKVATSKSNVLKYIDFVNNNLNSFQLSENVGSYDSLLRHFIKVNAQLQSILINNTTEMNRR